MLNLKKTIMTKEEFVHNAMLKLASNPAIVSVDVEGVKYIDCDWLAEVATEMAEAAENNCAFFEREKDADKVACALNYIGNAIAGEI